MLISRVEVLSEPTYESAGSFHSFSHDNGDVFTFDAAVSFSVRAAALFEIRPAAFRHGLLLHGRADRIFQGDKVHGSLKDFAAARTQGCDVDGVMLDLSGGVLYTASMGRGYFMYVFGVRSQLERRFDTV